MKSLSIIACLIVLGATCFAQAVSSSKDSDAQGQIAKSKAVLEAMKSKDAAALNGLLANDFRSVNMAGDFGNRGEMLGAAHEGFLKDFLFYDPQAFRIDNDSIMVSYNSSVVLSDSALKELAEDNLTWPRYSRVSDLWVRQDGEWKLKFEQVTPLRAMY
jgi:hypothetical protein